MKINQMREADENVGLDTQNYLVVDLVTISQSTPYLFPQPNRELVQVMVLQLIVARQVQ